jgi:hypothetical protein
VRKSFLCTLNKYVMTYYLAADRADPPYNPVDVSLAEAAADISALEASVATNVTDIASNVTGVSTNASGIASNVTAIGVNTSGIASNVTGVSTNASGIASNVTAIATNSSGVASNLTGVSTNTSGIASNATAIATNASGVASNVTDISTNTTAITTLNSKNNYLLTGTSSSTIYTVEAFGSLTAEIPGMTTTPAAGTYLVTFCASMASGHPDGGGRAELYVDGVGLAYTQREIHVYSGLEGQDVTMLAHITVDGTQVVEVRWGSISYGVNIYARALSLVEL